MNYEIFSAFVLGLLVAINPCQLAINISALTYIIKDNAKRGNGSYRSMMYVLGRTITYIVLAWVLLCLLGGGKNIDSVQALLSKGEELLPYALIIMGVFFLYRGMHHHCHEHGDNCHNSGLLIKKNGPMGALVLGLTLAFVFCPESAVLYFGVMLPLSVKSVASLLIPMAFSIGAALPVAVLAYVMGKTMNGVYRLSARLDRIQQVVNIVIGIAFVVVAVVMW